MNSMHINFVRGDMAVGYTKEAHRNYEEKVKELTENGFVLTDKDYGFNGDCHELYEKGNESFMITILAI